MLIRSKNLIFIFLAILMMGSGQLGAEEGGGMHPSPAVASAEDRRREMDTACLQGVAMSLWTIYIVSKITPSLLVYELRSASGSPESCLPPNTLSNDSKKKLETAQDVLAASAVLIPFSLILGTASIYYMKDHDRRFWPLFISTIISAGSGGAMELWGAIEIQKIYMQISDNWGTCMIPRPWELRNHRQQKFEIARGLTFTWAAIDIVSFIIYSIIVPCVKNARNWSAPPTETQTAS